eukprot:m.666529 g.666529  ORF g.666529 m.666529 type:complete len:69 (-) comp22749_c2_seq31:104-310(-)
MWVGGCVQFNPVSLAPVQDTGNPWREMLDIWNQKFAAEAYLPVALALSTWSTTDASAANVRGMASPQR